MAAVPDAYNEVMHYMLETEPGAAIIAWIIIVLITCLCTFLLLGLFVAVVTGTFANVQAIEAARAEAEATEEEDKKELTLLQRVEDAAKTMMGKKEDSTTDAMMSKRKAKMPVEDDLDVAEDEIMTSQMQEIVRSKWFFRAKSLVILIHIFGMATDSPNLPDFVEVSYMIHIACNCLFLAVALLSVVACASLGVWFASGANWFEALLIIAGFLGIAVGSKFLLIIPALRVYMLLLTFPTTETLLMSAVATVRAFADLFVFFIVIMALFAVIARYLFGQLIVDVTRSNWSTFPRAMLTLFQIFMGDSWAGVMYDSMFSKPGTFDQVISAMFVIAWLLVSNLAMMNLFVATIIQNFDIGHTIENIRQPGNVAAARNEVAR